MSRDIVTSAPQLPSTLVESAKRYASAARSDNTRRAYDAQWKLFVAWCADRNFTPMPATPQTIALYLTARADAGKKASTVEQSASAIAEAHRLKGHASPTEHLIVQEIMRGIRRTIGTAPSPKSPLLIEKVRTILDALLPTKDAAIRDRSLISLGFACAMRRSELAALNVEDVENAKDGLIVRIRRSKTDQEAKGATVGVPFGKDPDHCPVTLFETWKDTLGSSDGPLYVSISRWGKFGSRLDPKDVARIVKRAAMTAGMDSDAYSGHSLRSGLATSAARAKKPVHAIKRQGRWASTASLDKYIRDVAIFEDNPADLG